ncbi:hypothetical protein KSC_046100 [Ktedonobacter sp. SOSP1-52]|uniref:TOTE conflict system archaeo-eukaryotic primase domain-containing protein n=1 Tax=Ktedonobacter sp. SOSP1-52 TaxID=2778366 RepID=UPI001915A802|nr:CHC2 zinc finger domain-containing protein [Ktedonobacter sp. SOSP1-52]GHO65718.1 hypothetical protein KSC_046100 [Ktedonobacter sp. SOSP1-52]
MVSSQDLAVFSSLFIGRTDAYAVQLPTGSYALVKAPVTRQVLAKHLRGEQTIGSYVIDARGECRYAVLDADTGESGWQLLLSVQERLAKDGIVSYLERSRRGPHLWVFFSRPISAATARWWLLPYCPQGIEFFPKQDEAQRYGSLIRVPLGVHALSGERYPFVSWQHGQLLPVASSLQGMLAWLSRVERAEVPGFDIREVAGSRHRRGAATQEKSKGSTLTLAPPVTFYANIAQWSAAQDPFEVIGRYVRLNRNGVGHCPFTEHHAGGRDDHPSFRVYQPQTLGGSCWHCYASGRGGDVFNFLAQYHRLDSRTLWARLRAGEQF